MTGLIRTAGGRSADANVTAFSAVTGEPVQLFGGHDTPEGRPAGTFTIAHVAPQTVKLRWSTNDGRTGWVGGTSFTDAQPIQVRNNRSTTVNITV